MTIKVEACLQADDHDRIIVAQVAVEVQPYLQVDYRVVHDKFPSL